MSLTSGLKVVCETKEEFDRLRHKATKLRVILLERKDKNLFCKLSSFDRRDHNKFIKEINELWNTMSDQEIDDEFNDICVNKLFETGKDLTSYPVETLTYPDHSILYNPKKLEDINELVGDEEMKVSV